MAQRAMQAVLACLAQGDITGCNKRAEFCNGFKFWTRESENGYFPPEPQEFADAGITDP